MFGLIYRHKKLATALVTVASAAFLLWMFLTSNVKQMFGGSPCVAEVGDKCITLREYRFELMKYARYLDNPSFAPVVKRLVLNSLITREVLARKAEELGLLVSDEELLEVIKRNPNFQKNGKFSTKLYVDTLKRLNLTPQEYEDILRKSLMAKKVLNLVEKGVYVLPEEIDLQRRYVSTLFSGKLYIVRPKDVKLNYEPKEEELRKFYTQHKERYREEGRKVFYLWKVSEKDRAHEIYESLKKGEVPKGYLEINVPGGNLPDEVKNLAQELREGKFKLLKKGNTYYILFLKREISPRIKPYEEVKEEVKRDFMKKMRSEKLREYAERIKEKIEKGERVSLKPIRFKKQDLESLSRVVLIPSEDKERLVFGKEKVFGPYRVLNGMGILVIDRREQKKLNEKDIKKIAEEIRRTQISDLEGLFIDKLIRNYGVRVNKNIIK